MRAHRAWLAALLLAALALAGCSLTREPGPAAPAAQPAPPAPPPPAQPPTAVSPPAATPAQHPGSCQAVQERLNKLQEENKRLRRQLADLEALHKELGERKNRLGK